jgi:hypothetical protein
MGLPRLQRSNCAVCGEPKPDQIHLDAEAEADAESPNWG